MLIVEVVAKDPVAMQAEALIGAHASLKRDFTRVPRGKGVICHAGIL